MLRYLKGEDSEAKKNKLAEKVSETLYSNELMDFFLSITQFLDERMTRTFLLTIPFY